MNIFNISKPETYFLTLMAADFVGVSHILSCEGKKVVTDIFGKIEFFVDLQNQQNLI